MPQGGIGAADVAKQAHEAAIGAVVAGGDQRQFRVGAQFEGTVASQDFVRGSFIARPGGGTGGNAESDRDQGSQQDG